MPNTILTRLNYLGPLIAVEDVHKILSGDPTVSVIGDQIELFFGVPIAGLSEEILSRYAEVTPPAYYFPVVPHNEQISKRILEPLRQAKLNYCLGNYLATIALAGITAETLTFLIWRMHSLAIRGQTATPVDERNLLGKPFDDLPQDRKIGVLQALQYTAEPQAEMMRQIAGLRNQYVHWWDLTSPNEKSDAKSLLTKAMSLFKDVTGIGLSTTDPGSVTINPLLVRLVTPNDTAATP